MLIRTNMVQQTGLSMCDKKMEIIKSLKTCPICDSTNFDIIKKVEYPEGILKISRCNGCSVSFSSTRFTEEYLKSKYYSTDYEKDIVGHKNYENLSQRFFQNIFNKIQNLKKTGKWLDIGCGKGYLLEIASRNNFDCYGIDINDDFVENDHINFFNKDLFDLDFDNNKFDIITMCNSLDHIGLPKKYLEKIYNLLKPRGILFIHVPNEYYFDRGIFRNFTQYSPNVHLVNYSQKNIVYILEKFGFSKIIFLSPKYKQFEDKKRMSMIYSLELLNKLTVVFNRGIWLSMQVIAYK